MFVAEAVFDDKPRFHDIKVFLQTQEYPPGVSRNDKRTLRRLSSNFFLNGEVLYKRNFDEVFLKCVDRREADLLMHEIHEGSFKTHSNGYAMAKKALRSGYYLITMHADSHHYATSVRFMRTRFMYPRLCSMSFLPLGLSLCGALT